MAHFKIPKILSVGSMLIKQRGTKLAFSKLMASLGLSCSNKFLRIDIHFFLFETEKV